MASQAEILAQILSGGGDVGKDLLLADPFIQGGLAIQRAPTLGFNPDASPAANILAPLITNLVGGAALGFGQQRAARKLEDFQTQTRQALTSPDPLGTLGALSESTDNPTLRRGYQEIANSLLAQELGREQELQNVLQVQNARRVGSIEKIKQGNDEVTVQVGPDGQLIEIARAPRVLARPQISGGFARPAGPTLPDIDPLVQSAFAKAAARQLGQDADPITSEELAAVSRDPRRLEQLSGILRRAQTGSFQQDEKDFRQGQRDLIGFKDPEGKLVGLDPKVAAKLNEKSGSVASITFQLDELEGLIKEGGSIDVFGQDAATRRALMGSLFNEFRTFTNSGANFTESEQKLIKAVLPRLDSVDAFTDYVRGIDQAQFVRDAKSLVRKSHQARVFAQTGQIPEGVSLDRLSSVIDPNLIRQIRPDLLKGESKEGGQVKFDLPETLDADTKASLQNAARAQMQDFIKAKDSVKLSELVQQLKAQGFSAEEISALRK